MGSGNSGGKERKSHIPVPTTSSASNRGREQNRKSLPSPAVGSANASPVAGKSKTSKSLPPTPEYSKTKKKGSVLHFSFARSPSAKSEEHSVVVNNETTKFSFDGASVAKSEKHSVVANNQTTKFSFDRASVVDGEENRFDLPIRETTKTTIVIRDKKEVTGNSDAKTNQVAASEACDPLENKSEIVINVVDKNTKHDLKKCNPKEHKSCQEQNSTTKTAKLVESSVTESKGKTKRRSKEINTSSDNVNNTKPEEIDSSINNKNIFNEIDFKDSFKNANLKNNINNLIANANSKNPNNKGLNNKGLNKNHISNIRKSSIDEFEVFQRTEPSPRPTNKFPKVRCLSNHGRG